MEQVRIEILINKLRQIKCNDLKLEKLDKKTFDRNYGYF